MERPRRPSVPGVQRAARSPFRSASVEPVFVPGIDSASVRDLFYESGRSVHFETMGTPLFAVARSRTPIEPGPASRRPEPGGRSPDLAVGGLLGRCVAGRWSMPVVGCGDTRDFTEVLADTCMWRHRPTPDSTVHRRGGLLADRRG
jgi:hypothetical protein